MHASDDSGIYDYAYLFEYNFAAIFLPAKEDHAEMKVYHKQNFVFCKAIFSR